MKLMIIRSCTNDANKFHLLKHENIKDEFEKILEDAPAIAENTWNKKKRGDYNSFVKCDNHCVSIFRKIIK